MAQTEKGIIYPYDYNEVADVPADLKALAESIDALLNDYSLNTDSGNKIVLEMNNTTYKIKAILKDKDDNVICTSNEIDLPLENMVTNITYNNQTLTLTHQDGQTTEVSIADLISDLASKEEVAELQSQVDDLTTLVETELESNEVEGTEIDVSDSAEYRGGIEVKGNTEQEQLSGINKIALAIEGAEYSHNYPNNYSSSYLEVKQNTQLLAGDYTMVFDMKSLSNGKFNKVQLKGPSNLDIVVFTLYRTIPTTYKKYIKPFTIIEDTEIREVFLQNAEGEDTFYLKDFMIIPGTYTEETVPDYEQYCGEQEAPNPSYEIPIKVVTGDNVIKHVGKNEFYGEDLGLWYNGTSKNFNQLSGFKSLICKVKPNTQYTISKKNVSNRFVLITSEDKPRVSLPYTRLLIVDNNRTNYTFITLSNENYIFLGVYSGTDETEIAKAIEEIQLEEGTEATSYEPYREEEYKLDLWKENEFDSENAEKLNAYFSDNEKIIASSNSAKTVVVSCKSNTTYRISKKQSSRFRVGYSSSKLDYSGILDYAKMCDSEKEVIIQTNSTAKYMYIYYYSSSSDTLTEQEILESIKIQEAIELCKIDDYEDIPFKNEVGDENYNAELENGAWYKKGVIGKQILNGTENWTTAINRNTYNKVAKQIQLQNAILNKGSISNLIVSQHFRSESADNIFNNNAIGINCAGISTAGYLRVGLELDKFPTDSSFKEWLAQNNDVVRFPVQTPTYEKITDPTLISQLEALRKAKWFKGINHWWTETENLEPNLKGTYKQSNNLRLQALEQAIVALGGV